jgi:hypothetical protein
MTNDSDPTFAPEDVRHVHIDTRIPTAPVMTLDGVDIRTDIAGITIQMDPKHTPLVTLIVPADRVQAAHFEGLAVTELMTAGANDPGPAAAVFLKAIDAKILEQTALNRIDLGNDPQALTKAMIRQLIDWAEGKS